MADDDARWIDAMAAVDAFTCGLHRGADGRTFTFEPIAGRAKDILRLLRGEYRLATERHAAPPELVHPSEVTAANAESTWLVYACDEERTMFTCDEACHGILSNGTITRYAAEAEYRAALDDLRWQVAMGLLEDLDPDGISDDRRSCQIANAPDLNDLLARLPGTYDKRHEGISEAGLHPVKTIVFASDAERCIVEHLDHPGIIMAIVTRHTTDEAYRAALAKACRADDQ